MLALPLGLHGLGQRTGLLSPDLLTCMIGMVVSAHHRLFSQFVKMMIIKCMLKCRYLRAKS